MKKNSQGVTIKAVKNLELFPRVTFLDKLLFTKHLSILIESGVTIVESLDILAEQTGSDVFRQVVSAISSDIKNGQTFASALSKHPNVFNTLYVSLIEVGEKSGTLDTNLTYLAEQLSKEYAFRKKVKGALMYPTIVFVAAVVVGFSISIFALPKLIDLFQGFDVALPITTQILLWFANVMKSFGIFIAIVFVGLVFLARYLISLPSVKPVWQSFQLSIPVVGLLIINAELSLLCRSLGIMLKSGLPITTALEIQAKISSNAVFIGYAQNLLGAVTNGKPLSQELESGYYPKIPIIMTKMIAVGERTGNLDKTLVYLGEFFEGEVDDATKNLSTIIEPIMLLFVGLIVAFVALAIISPIYQLTGSIKK
ncbi:MAG TPA: type II secretion system F family protein [Candidatus Saccharimonadales bacterium]|nr:type II secretion system F family protein [Candidatus Saccharimonadales bacterium]